MPVSLFPLNGPRTQLCRWASILALACIATTSAASAQLGAGGHQYWDQNVVPGATSETEDLFASSLASGDFNGDGFLDLAVTEPRADVGGVVEAGRVHVFYYFPLLGSFWTSRIDTFDLAQFYSGITPEARRTIWALLGRSRLRRR